MFLLSHSHSAFDIVAALFLDAERRAPRPCLRKSGLGRRDQRESNALNLFSLSLSLSPFKKKKKQSHTILLYQMGKSPNSRTFADFPSPPKAADGCIASFEESLKLKNATKSQISYAASDLHAWLDSLPQAGALVFDAKLQAYVPFDKAWLKQQVLLRLQELARAAAARQQGQGAAQGGRRR